MAIENLRTMTVEEYFQLEDNDWIRNRWKVKATTKSRTSGFTKPLKVKTRSRYIAWVSTSPWLMLMWMWNLKKIRATRTYS